MLGGWGSVPHPPFLCAASNAISRILLLVRGRAADIYSIASDAHRVTSHTKESRMNAFIDAVSVLVPLCLVIAAIAAVMSYCL